MATVADHCTCHSIREGSGGVSFSYAILGVECPACEARNAEWAWESFLANESYNDRCIRLLEDTVREAGWAIARRKEQAESIAMWGHDGPPF